MAYWPQKSEAISISFIHLNIHKCLIHICNQHNPVHPKSQKDVLQERVKWWPTCRQSLSDMLFTLSSKTSNTSYTSLVTCAQRCGEEYSVLCYYFPSFLLSQWCLPVTAPLWLLRILQLSLAPSWASLACPLALTQCLRSCVVAFFLTCLP